MGTPGMGTQPAGRAWEAGGGKYGGNGDTGNGGNGDTARGYLA